MDFRFTSDLPPSRIDEVVDLMLQPRLWVPNTDYPDLVDWSQKVALQLASGEKRIIAGIEGRTVKAVVVYQQHSSGGIELKNLSVEPSIRGRHVASFLIRNAEVEGQVAFGATSVVCDAKASNHSVRCFLIANGYRVADRRDLYGLGAGDDFVYRKSLVLVTPRLV